MTGCEIRSRRRSACQNVGTVLLSPSFPVQLVTLPNGDVLMLPAVWPVRLTPEQQRQLVERLEEAATPEVEPESAPYSSSPGENTGELEPVHVGG